MVLVSLYFTWCINFGVGQFPFAFQSWRGFTLFHLMHQSWCVWVHFGVPNGVSIKVIVFSNLIWCTKRDTHIFELWLTEWYAHRLKDLLRHFKHPATLWESSTQWWDDWKCIWPSQGPHLRTFSMFQRSLTWEMTQNALQIWMACLKKPRAAASACWVNPYHPFRECYTTRRRDDPAFSISRVSRNALNGWFSQSKYFPSRVPRIALS